MFGKRVSYCDDGGAGVSFMLMSWDAAMCSAYYERGFRAGLTLPVHVVQPLEDAACAYGYCDCFREGYMQGVAEREQCSTGLHVADVMVWG